MPVAEAMAAGLPVVATRDGAIGEILAEGRSGLLVPRGDVEALAGALGRLLEDGERRREMGETGRVRAVGEFTWDRVVERLVGLYEGSGCERTGNR